MSNTLKFIILSIIAVGVAGTVASIAVGNIPAAIIFGVSTIVLALAFTDHKGLL